MRRFLQHVILVTIGLVISLGAVEIFLRMFMPQPIYAIRYCYLGWCHVPGARFVHGGEHREFVTHVQYNSHGLRDQEYPIEKADGQRRILVFGGSYAEAIEVELEQHFAKRLESSLQASLRDPAIQVINFGVSAYDTAQEWWYFRTQGACYGPDLVVVIWGGEAGSPYAALQGGQPVFLEPAYSRAQIWGRELQTFLKLHFHTASFLLQRLGANRSRQDFEAEFAPRGGQTGAWMIPRGTPPTLPFAAGWEEQLAIFEDFQRAAAERGASVIVAAINTLDHRYLVDSLKLRPIPGLLAVDLQHVAGEEEMSYHFAKDGHWTVRGHEKAATILGQFIAQEHLLDAPRRSTLAATCPHPARGPA